MTPTVSECGCLHFSSSHWKIDDAIYDHTQQHIYQLTIDSPPDMQERVACSIIAVVEYEIPANILLAIVEKEGGMPSQWVGNSNGTHNVGAMQFNTTYLRDLSKYGITVDHVVQVGCHAYELAA